MIDHQRRRWRAASGPTKTRSASGHVRSLGNETYTIIGVVGDVQQLRAWTKETGRTMYVPIGVACRAACRWSSARAVSRSGATSALRAACSAWTRTCRCTDVKTMEQLLPTRSRSRRFKHLLLGIFAALALCSRLGRDLRRDGLYASRSARTRSAFAWRWARSARDVLRLVIGARNETGARRRGARPGAAFALTPSDDAAAVRGERDSTR